MASAIPVLSQADQSLDQSYDPEEDTDIEKDAEYDREDPEYQRENGEIFVRRLFSSGFPTIMTGCL